MRDDHGEPLFTYRSFASVVGLVAALMATVVFITGLAAVLFLMAEGRPGAAVIAILLSIAFSAVMAMIVPPLSVELRANDETVLAIRQRSRFAFPWAELSIEDAGQQKLAQIRRSVFSRAERNRWTVFDPDGRRVVAVAVEESLGRALVRKVAGKFRRTLEANVMIRCHGLEAGTIVRRPTDSAYVDYLAIDPGSELDPRIAIALATVILGSEP